MPRAFAAADRYDRHRCQMRQSASTGRLPPQSPHLCGPSQSGPEHPPFPLLRSSAWARVCFLAQTGIKSSRMRVSVDPEVSASGKQLASSDSFCPLFDETVTAIAGAKNIIGCKPNGAAIRVNHDRIWTVQYQNHSHMKKCFDACILRFLALTALLAALLP